MLPIAQVNRENVMEKNDITELQRLVVRETSNRNAYYYLFFSCSQYSCNEKWKLTLRSLVAS